MFGSALICHCFRAQLTRSSVAGGGGDTTAPVVANVNVNSAGTLLTINWTEAGSAPVVGSVGLSLDGMTYGAATLSNVVTSGTQTTATISRPIFDDETITLSYASGNFADSAANAVADFSGQAIANNSSQTVGSYSNALKLAIDSGTPAGTFAYVTDAVSVAGSGEPECDGAYVPVGNDTVEGEPVYRNFAVNRMLAVTGFRTDPSGGGANTQQWGICRGGFLPDGSDAQDPAYWGDQGVTNVGPDEVTWSTSAPVDRPPFAESPAPSVVMGVLQKLTPIRLVTPLSSMIAFYQLDEDPQVTALATDILNGNNLDALVGGSELTASAGKIGNGFFFGGLSTSVGASNDNFSTNGGDFHFWMWVKRITSGDVQWLGKVTNDSGTEWELKWLANDHISFGNGASAVDSGAVVSSAGEWHLVQCWYHAGVWSLKIDNGTTQTASIAAPVSDADTAIEIGGGGGAFTLFAGWMDAVGYRAAAPSLGDLDAVWNNGMGIEFGATSLPAEEVNWRAA